MFHAPNCIARLELHHDRPRPAQTDIRKNLRVPRLRFALALAYLREGAEVAFAPTGPGLGGSPLCRQRPESARIDEFPPAVLDGPAGEHRLSVYSAGGPGHRTFGRRIVCQEPALLRPGKHRQTGG